MHSHSPLSCIHTLLCHAFTLPLLYFSVFLYFFVSSSFNETLIPFLLHFIQGISYNNLSGRVFCGILSCLQRNSSLGSLDVSHNSLKHSAHVKESLRQFLRHNKGIRTLDLSHNKFTAETTNVIHLGLLENDGKYLRTCVCPLFLCAASCVCFEVNFAGYRCVECVSFQNDAMYLHVPLRSFSPFTSYSPRPILLSYPILLFSILTNLL